MYMLVTFFSTGFYHHWLVQNDGLQPRKLRQGYKLKLYHLLLPWCKGSTSCPKNHGISSHWWPLEIQKNPALQSQHPSFLEGPMILRVWIFSLQSFFQSSDAYRLGVYPCLLLFFGWAFFRMLTPRKIVSYTGILSKYDINEGWWKYVYLPFFGGIQISWRVYISYRVRSHNKHYPPWKLTWQWKIAHLKMYFLSKMVIVQWHVSFRGWNKPSQV